MTPQQTKSSENTEFEAGKKAYHEAMQKAQSQVTAATAEVHKLRAEMKTQTAEARDKTMEKLHEATKQLDAARKQEQQAIEAHLKAIHADIVATDAELKHATAAAKKAAEARAKVVQEEYDAAKRSLVTVMDAELAEWKTRIDEAQRMAAQVKADVKKSVDAKIADAHAKQETAQKKLHALKQANATAFNEVQRGVQAAIGEVKTALEHARADITKAL